VALVERVLPVSPEEGGLSCFCGSFQGCALGGGGTLGSLDGGLPAGTCPAGGGAPALSVGAGARGGGPLLRGLRGAAGGGLREGLLGATTLVGGGLWLLEAGLRETVALDCGEVVAIIGLLSVAEDEPTEGLLLSASTVS